MPVIRAGEVLRSRALLAAALALACFLAWPAAATAESFFVNTVADEADAAPGNEFCETAAGKCSLRAAIEEANFTLEAFDEIHFEEEPFNGGSGSVIELGSGLPTIVSPLGMRGRECETQSGAFGPCVEIDGVAGAPGLAVEEARESEIESLAITGAEIGVAVSESPKLRLRSNWLGVGLDGSAAGNGTGIEFGPGTGESRIGGEGPGTGNVVVDSTGSGLDLLGASDVRVLGNVFGITPTGAPAANGTDIAVASTEASPASDNTIGTRVSDAALATAKCDGGCNLVSGSASSGIDLAGDGGERLPAVGTTIAGNQIGLDPSGEASLPNTGAGVLVGTASRTVIGGPRAGDANSFAGGTAAVAAGPGAPYLVVRGNLVGAGAGPAGAADPPEDGILVDSEGLLLAAEEALILENVIGLGGGTGISQKGLGGEISGNSVTGAEIGIRVFGEGGENLVEANSVAATKGAGILVENSFNEIAGNEVAGAGAAGIRVDGSAIPLFGISGNVIGGDAAGAENTIAGSGGAAVEIENAELSQTEVARNHGGGNAGPFIDLVTAAGESEAPNGGILPPTIDVASQAAAAGLAAPGAKVRVFRKQTSAAGEIESFLGQAVADEDGNWSLAFPGGLPVGVFLAATQTNELGGTSELAIAAVTGPSPGGGQSSDASPSDPGGDRRAPHTEILRQSRELARSNAVRFFFASNERGSRFQCSLDSGGFRGCKSPKRYGKLAPGRHVFRVRAIDRAGNVDPTPAKRRFRISG